MTISITKARAVHNGSGSTGPFAIADGADGIYFAASSELLVTKTVDGTESVLALGSDYTVTGAGSASGTLTLAVALAVGETLVIERRTALTQTVNLSSSGAFSPAVVMGALDKLTRQSQDHRARIDRSVELYKDDVEGSGSFNARDNAIAKTKYLELKEIATPSDPATGYHRLFVKDDGDLYLVNSDGEEFNISVQVTSAATATAAAATAVAALDAFEDLYLGAKASDPSVDNDGDPLVDGMLYYNTSNDELKVYTGSAWSVASPYPVTSVDNAIGAVVVNAAKPFATRTALKAADTTKITLAVLTEGKRGGVFVWTTGDYADEIAADTLGGVYLKADAVAAASGAWVRVDKGAIRVEWFGATGDGSTDDRAACQAAIDLAESRGGGIIKFGDGTFKIGPTTAPDSGTFGLDDGLVIPYISAERDNQIRLVADGQATLKAGADDMIVVRVCDAGAELHGLEIDGGGAYFTAYDNTVGVLVGAADRTDDATFGSSSFFKMTGCYVQGCKEGLYFECGPTVTSGPDTGSGYGAFYPVIMNNDWNANVRHMWFGAGALTPDNRPTRGVIANNRITRGAIGIDLEHVTEFTLQSNHYELLNSSYPIGPRGFRTAVYVGEDSEINTWISGYAEDTDNGVYIHASALPNAMHFISSINATQGVNTNATFSPLLNQGRIRLTKETASNQQLRLEFMQSSGVTLTADTAADGTRDLAVYTNGTQRLHVGASGGLTHKGSISDIILNSAGTGIQHTRNTTVGLTCATAGGAWSITANGGTTVNFTAFALWPGTDNVMNLGSTASFRWKEIFCALGTINTSDARHKKWRGGLSDAELRVAAKVAKLTGVYQMLASIEEKGDAARLHVGIRVQDVIACFEAEGLDAFRYSMICYDKWDDITEPVLTTVNWPIFDSETGERVIDPDTGEPHYEEREVETGEVRVTKPAGDLYGIRDGQLRAFVQAAQEQRLDALEKRLAALEA